jgi:hypothetical protein
VRGIARSCRRASWLRFPRVAEVAHTQRVAGELAMLMGGGQTHTRQPRIDIAIPMALVKKSVTSELNRPGVRTTTTDGQGATVRVPGMHGSCGWRLFM